MVVQTDFVPKRRLVSNVTNATAAVVTTTEDHGYETEQFVRLFVPAVYGMFVYYQQTKIIVIDDVSFVTTIDTSTLLPFVEPVFEGINPFTPAQVVPITGVEDNIAGQS